MNWIKTFEISKMTLDLPGKIDKIVNEWVETNQVAVVNASVSVDSGGSSVLVVLVYQNGSTQE